MSTIKSAQLCMRPPVPGASNKAHRVRSTLSAFKYCVCVSLSPSCGDREGVFSPAHKLPCFFSDAPWEEMRDSLVNSSRIGSCETNLYVSLALIDRVVFPTGNPAAVGSIHDGARSNVIGLLVTDFTSKSPVWVCCEYQRIVAYDGNIARENDISVSFSWQNPTRQRADYWMPL